MGSNVGHQIIKMYEPELYPHNPTPENFQRFFGNTSDRGTVCTFGFEAVPLQREELLALETYLTGLQRRVRIFTAQAVSVAEGPLEFYQDPGLNEHHQGGAWLTTETITDKTNFTQVIVPAIVSAQWMHLHVLQRALYRAVRGSLL